MIRKIFLSFGQYKSVSLKEHVSLRDFLLFIEVIITWWLQLLEDVGANGSWKLHVPDATRDLQMSNPIHNNHYCYQHYTHNDCLNITFKFKIIYFNNMQYFITKFLFANEDENRFLVEPSFIKGRLIKHLFPIKNELNKKIKNCFYITCVGR